MATEKELVAMAEQSVSRTISWWQHNASRLARGEVDPWKGARIVVIVTDSEGSFVGVASNTNPSDVDAIIESAYGRNGRTYYPHNRPEVEPLPVKRLRRTGDMQTSVDAAAKASRASKRAIEAVRDVMSDGEARIDEEIWHACRANGYVSSFDTVRHGRLALSEGGELIATAVCKTTKHGAAATAWVRRRNA